MWQELNFSEIKAKGWIKKYLETQARGMTGEMDKIGKPFSLRTWGSRNETDNEGYEAFVGGMVTDMDSWVPYEQTGYWIDGTIRAGRLIDNEKLIKLAGSRIYPQIACAHEDGYLGPDFLKGSMTWAHAVYLRALMAEYTATGDEKILEALKKHFLARPLKDVYHNVKSVRIIGVRNVADIEVALWIYGQTKDERFLQMAEESYEEWNRIYEDDSEAGPGEEMYDLTVKGMLGNRKVERNHGVTYCEICKLAAILHLYTGKEIYKKAAVNAFDKVYRDQMIVDGVFSSSEYLNGNENSWAVHETCDVSDFTWAIGYLYMITGDAKYGDWVEDAIFNAGLGSVDDDFKGNQYFSGPNQVIANDHSNHAQFYRGRDWMSYAPEKFLACCAGNVHRFMPNYVYRSWMRDGNNLAAFTYAPSEIQIDIKGSKVRIEEDTKYPFENVVRFHISTEKPVAFGLVLRQPNWAKKTMLIVNGEKVNAKFENGTYRLERMFSDKDEIILSFTDEIQLIENAKGISVKKGALLYALPVEEKVVIEGVRELGNEEFPHYSLYPESKWNYGLCVDKARYFKVTEGSVGEEPWRREQNALTITVKGKEVFDWKVRNYKSVQGRLWMRGPCKWEKGEAQLVGQVNEVKLNAKLGEERELTLVPYATTRLRVGIFPIIK